MRAEIICIHFDYKMWIPHIHHRSRDTPHSLQLDRPSHHARHAHPAFNLEHRRLRLHHPARPHAAMRPQRNLHQPFALSQPRRHTPRPIARKLRLAPIGVEQPQKKRAIPSPLQKLDPIRSHACRPRAQPLRQLNVPPRCRALLNNQEVIPARMRLHKSNHLAPYFSDR
jgi:hypothetical protein